MASLILTLKFPSIQIPPLLGASNQHDVTETENVTFDFDGNTYTYRYLIREYRFLTENFKNTYFATDLISLINYHIGVVGSSPPTYFEWQPEPEPEPELSLIHI